MAWRGMFGYAPPAYRKAGAAFRPGHNPKKRGGRPFGLPPETSSEIEGSDLVDYLVVLSDFEVIQGHVSDLNV